MPIILDNIPSALPFIQSALILLWWRHLAAFGRVAQCAHLTGSGLEPVNRMAYYGILGPKGLPKRWWTKSAQPPNRLCLTLAVKAHRRHRLSRQHA